MQGLVALARELKIWLLIGSALVRREDGGAANRSMLIDPSGRTVVTYDKIHMFDVDLPTGERVRESEAYTPGCEAVVVRDTVRQAGPDRLLRHPLSLSLSRARQGRGGDPHRAGRIHPPDRRGALGDPAARPRDRVRGLRARTGAGRASRRRPWHVGALDGRRSLGRDPGAGAGRRTRRGRCVLD